MRSFVMLLPLAAACGGCPVWQSQQVPVPATLETEQTTGVRYWRYVPTGYSPDRAWPMAVALHGTIPYDTAKRQIDEWKRLAEDEHFIVVAPELQSTQGLSPIVDKNWTDKLKRDEKVILAVMDEMCQNYRIESSAILLHGFSAGGFPLLYTGLHNPERFSAMVARGCNCRQELLDQLEVTDETRKLPVLIICGKDDSPIIQKQSWMAFRFLRENRCFKAEHDEFRGGHIRRPDLAYKYWRRHWPKQPES